MIPIEGIVETVKEYGLKYFSKKTTIPEIKDFINKYIPVIVVSQAWTKKVDIDWRNDWEDGYYVTAIGYDKDKIYFKDPSSFERVFLYYNEFKDRWHDVDVNGKKFINHGIAIYGKENTFNLEKIIHLD